MKYLKIFFSPTILLFSLFLFFYTFYKSEIIYDSNKLNYYLTYYIFSLILFLFSIFSFFFSSKTKEYLIIIIISILVSLYTYEIFFILKDNFTYKEKVYEEITGKKFDKRSLHEIYSDLNSIEEVVVPIRPNAYLKKNKQLFPLSGISESKTILCNENGYYATFNSDRFGFNNNDKEWDSNKFEYLLIGDSFTLGECVNTEDNIASVLKKLTNKSVLNLGHGGNGPLINYATLKEYITPNIRNILWIYYEGNDLSDLERELKNNFLNKYLNDENFFQNLSRRQNEINILHQEILLNANNKNKKFNFNNIKEFLKLNLTRSILQNYIPSKYNPQNNPSPKLKKILSLANNLAIKNKSKLYFVYLPSYQRYKINKDFGYNKVKKIVSDFNIKFIDIHKDVFNKEDDPLSLFPFRLNGHYTVEGYRKVAEKIYEITSN